jgi:hypothetical protein
MAAVRLGNPLMLDRPGGSRTSAGPIVSVGSRPHSTVPMSGWPEYTSSNERTGPKGPAVTPPVLRLRPCNDLVSSVPQELQQPVWFAISTIVATNSHSGARCNRGTHGRSPHLALPSGAM